jgi:glutamate-5-semialdehyde dehydrogenase
MSRDATPAPATPAPVDLGALLRAARAAQRTLPSGPRDDGLRRVAQALRSHGDAILRANEGDVARETAQGTSAALVDRLRLDAGRLEAIARACEQVADLPDPLHRVLRGWRLDAGPDVREVTVPFGVIGVIYESRPNVTVDAAALALKAGSAAVLRGSGSALASNRALVAAMRAGLRDAGLPEEAVTLIDSADRRYVGELLAARGEVDLAIPRGGASLIAHVVETAKVPVIETGVGVCHVYVHGAADLAMAEAIVLNAKTQRPGVCNAAETLLVDAQVAESFLPGVARRLREAGVELRGCERTRALVGSGVAPADDRDWAEEYLDLILAVRVVDGLDAAIDHVGRYGTRHSEAIVTVDRDAARRFQEEVDAAAVYVNASTRFTDGYVFGFGAEIGISTQKMHARGPMGLEQLVTRKYLIDGSGEVRA